MRTISQPRFSETNISTLSLEETFNEGRKFASRLKGGEVIALVGELGTGKTVFTKGICEGLNVGDSVISPTFTIANEYEGDLRVFHFDAYRLSGSSEMSDIGIEDYMIGNAVCIIEWADRVEEIIHEDAIWIYFHHDGVRENGRLLKMKLRREPVS